jgi:hypothetical protein
VAFASATCDTIADSWIRNIVLLPIGIAVGLGWLVRIGLNQSWHRLVTAPYDGGAVLEILSCLGFFGFLAFAAREQWNDTRWISIYSDGRLVFRGFFREITVRVSDLISVRSIEGDDEQPRVVDFKHTGGSIRTWEVEDMDQLMIMLRRLNPNLEVERDW